MEIYQDRFSEWADVQREYDMKELEPKRVLLALYSAEMYEGSSLVVFEDNGKFYVNQGSHCSCYGLEDQWSPTQYDNKEEFIRCFEIENFYDNDMSRAQKEILEQLRSEV